jgi:succinoglycan biosynthesis transport protein ExoP
MPAAMRHSLDAFPLSPPPEAAVGGVTLAQVGRAVLRSWKWIVVPALFAFVASAVFVTMVSPRYTGEAKLLLESRDSYYTRPGQDRAMDQSQLIDEQAVASQVQVVMSRDLAREAIKRLKLVGNPEFDPLVGGVGPVKRLMMLFGAGNPLERPPEDRVLETYYERLLVYPQGKSRILTVEFRSKDPELAARAANTIAELYLELQEAAKKDTARTASTWLGTNIEALRTRLAQAEAKVEEFRARTGLLMGSNNATITAQQLSELNTQLSQARSALAESQAKARLIRDLIKSGRTFEIPDVANNELVRRLTEQRVSLRAQIAFESRTLLPGHPRMKELSAQLADLEAQIRGAAERTVRTLENDATIAASRVETIQATLDAQKTVVGSANENEVQLRALEREARAHRDQLEAYLGRYREATARDVENAVPPDARIVSRAIVPSTASFPKKVPIVALMTLAGAVMGAAAVLARELLSERPAAPLRAPGPDTAWAAAELARLRRAAGPNPRTTAMDGGGDDVWPVLDDRYDLEPLVHRLERAESAGQARRVLVTTCDDRAAARDVAKALGRVLALKGRAIVVALDPADDDAADQLGFTDLVAGEASFAAIIEREPGSRLHTVAPGTIDRALLAQEWEGVEIALSAFDQTYDWVICVLQDAADEHLFGRLAGRVDAAIIASDAEPTDEALVRLYDGAKAAGAADVVVVREREPADAAARVLQVA